MTACERASTLFGRAWDDELTVAEKDGLERHFTTCTPCRREYDELARTLELVQALPRPQVDDSFATRVLAEAQARERAGASAGRRPFALPAWWSAPSFGRPALALAATFVVAVGIGAFLLTRPAGGPTTAPVPSPVATLVAPSTSTSVPAPSTRPDAGSIARAKTPAPREARVATTTTPGTVDRESAPAQASANLAAATTPTELDSLFDHSADVELVLDPVQLRRERGRGYTPSTPTVKGETASITF
jgi:anti-sigma factor RsiW